MQRLLNFYAWDTDGVRDDVHVAVVDVLGDSSRSVSRHHLRLQHRCKWSGTS
jgi:hypothetical protein